MPSLIPCPACRKQISNAAPACPHCGHVPTEQEKTEAAEAARRTGIVAGIVVGLFALTIILSCATCSRSSKSTSSSPSPAATTHHETVENSAWDGSVIQVQRYVRDNANDGGSVKFVEWSPVQKTTNGGYMVRCKYRAKNAFGAYMLANQLFYLDSHGNVTEVRNWGS